jgi:hypothetical protein
VGATRKGRRGGRRRRNINIWNVLDAEVVMVKEVTFCVCVIKLLVFHIFAVGVRRRLMFFRLTVATYYVIM